MSSKVFTLNVLEQCRVSPPPNSTQTKTFPLTFLDIPWLFFSPNNPLFFYEFPHSVSHFMATIVPKLKLSLSLTLQHYYPFAASFVSPPGTGKPHLVFTDGNSVSLEIAESNGDFDHCCSYYPRDASEFHLLAPKLTPCEKKDSPLLAIQVTIFRNAGFCIGIAYHHVVADGRTFNNFVKTWASYCRYETTSFNLKLIPFYDRSVIIDTHELEVVFLGQWRKRKLAQGIAIGREVRVDLSGMVRATFTMGSAEMEHIKHWIIARCKKKNLSQPLRLSPYILTCAFLWVCLLKTHRIEDENDPSYFGFVAGGMTRLPFSVPTTYLGNFVGFGRASGSRNELLGEDGIVVAAKAIAKTVKQLDLSIFSGSEKWVLDWDVLFGSEHHVMVTGSPKVDLYGTDFGWGRPKKIEDISIDNTKAISLTESRDLEGGIEIGIALPKDKMDIFTILFTQGLKALS
ncbi:hypothetical protein L6164_023001 [Bauhinia variegata]|uniref:Uncharacterized protein n=1 Tax=Bauhinia variegata TaxID=167791 RepID=A0ACB9MIT0_BAUVA|nr:hypothetical protein L6164_023001 [Bauhinia variegata]